MKLIYNIDSTHYKDSSYDYSKMKESIDKLKKENTSIEINSIDEIDIIFNNITDNYQQLYYDFFEQLITALAIIPTIRPLNMINYIFNNCVSMYNLVYHEILQFSKSITITNANYTDPFISGYYNKLIIDGSNLLSTVIIPDFYDITLKNIDSEYVYITNVTLLTIENCPNLRQLKINNTPKKKSITDCPNLLI